MRVFEQIRTLEPEDLEARRQLVDLDYRLNQDQNALTEADSYVALVEGAGKRQLAIDFLKALIEAYPTRLEFRKRLSDVYIRNRQVTEAVEQLDTIADAFIAAGNRGAAISVVQSIIALNPVNVVEYHEVLNRLRTGEI
jgi:tetratricopeptide (TPR) repeat protein